MISVQEAATRLQVTPQRVLVMLQQSLLVGQQIGKIWTVDEASVAARVGTSVGAGRPLAPRTARALIDAMTDPDTAVLRSRDRNFLVRSDAMMIATKIRQACHITRYSSRWAEKVAEHLNLTGDSAVNRIAVEAGSQILPDKRAIHGYVRSDDELRTLIRDARLVEDSAGAVHVYSFKDDVFPWEQTPLALVAVDCALSMRARVKSAGLAALERMQTSWVSSTS
jgi:hypothetical protein